MPHDCFSQSMLNSFSISVSEKLYRIKQKVQMPHYITQVFVLLIYEYVFPKTDKQNSTVEYDHNKFKFMPQLWGGSVAVAKVVLVVELAFEVAGLEGSRNRWGSGGKTSG